MSIEYAAIIILLAAVLFLLYLIYKDKYGTGGMKKNSTLLQDFPGKDVPGDAELGLIINSKLHGFEERVSELEGRLERQEDRIKKLVRGLGE